MKYFQLLFFFIAVICFSQNYELKYHYIYNYDSVNSSNINKEDVYVIKQNDMRLYLSNNVLETNRIQYYGNKNNENHQEIWKKLNNVPLSKISSIIYQKENKTTINKKLGTIIYETKIDCPQINWKFSNEKHHSNLELKKATTIYLGRKWIAWYNESIVINDGPFLFNNLPGLIVELYDDENYFNWTLLEYNLETKEDYIKLIEDRTLKVFDISNNEFNTIIKKDFYNPITAIEGSGIKVPEDRKKRIVEYLKNVKYRFILKDTMLYL
ncbi:GLPGLI family protein [Empedobacter falsenii]|uniref:GLPGLI family protein n=1 Tax=Empedobacter falsenii TaxID=343874 RepID=UPI0025769D6A|nr:GLPGLI family protein [Empedobacter falsenii]MDM1299675.1 GLPGLI family protein [Empedobacter falsenii]MDM1319468.1 GLPGLI family protein [Empedobacter falsenii]